MTKIPATRSTASPAQAGHGQPASNQTDSRYLLRKRDLPPDYQFEELPSAKRTKTSASAAARNAELPVKAKTITFMTTGGTVGSERTNEQGGYGPSDKFGPEKLREHVVLDPGTQVTDRQLFGTGIDSKNHTDKHWAEIGDEVRAVKSDSVVMSHGTDALALDAFHQQLTLPRERLENHAIMLFGAMRPSDHPDADGKHNSQNAFTAAQTDFKGLAVVGAKGRLLVPPYFDKRHTEDVDAIVPVNGPQAGTIRGNKVSLRKDQPQPALPPRSFDIEGVTLPNIFTLSARPGTDPQNTLNVIDSLVHEHQIDGLVFKGTGGGTGHDLIMGRLNEIAKQIPVVRTQLPGAGRVEKDKHHPDTANQIASSGRLPSGGHARVLLTVSLAAWLKEQGCTSMAQWREKQGAMAKVDIPKVLSAFDDYQ